MAVIAGLEEQKAALKRVRDNLKEVEEINESLSNIKAYVADAKSKEYKLECSFLFKDDSLKKIKIPIVINDVEFILNSLKTYKDDIVKNIKADSSEFHISLSPQEESSLM